MGLIDDAVGYWPMETVANGETPDASDGGRGLALHGATPLAGTHGCRLDGHGAFLHTSAPVLRTDRPYSVAAWVRLEGDQLDRGLSMEEDEYAWTAASQSSHTHSPFYLGIRKHPDGDGVFSLYWNITMAPVDGSVTGTLEWRHAYGAAVSEAMLDRWHLLVGVSDTASRQVRLHVPGLTQGMSQAPDEWPYWQSDGAFEIGRARWLGNPVDYWPGSVGPALCFDRALTEAEAQELASQTSWQG